MNVYSKYRNRKTEIDGIVFDSLKEGRRYQELKLLEKAGFVKDIRLQVPFVLLPSQKNTEGKVVERKVSYYADFVYKERKGDEWQTVVEDVKGTRTEVYRLKRKLMLFVHGIEVQEY